MMNDLQPVIIISQLPVLLIFSYVYFKDRNAKSPLWALVACFALGALSTFLAVSLGMFFGADPEMEADWNMKQAFVFFMFHVAFFEELSKLLVCRFFTFRLNLVSEPFDGLIFGAASALGFAALENFLYTAQQGLDVGMWRMFTAVPMHAACGIIGGYYIGLAKFSKTSSWSLQFQGLCTAVAAHGLYDFFCYAEAVGLIFISLFVLILAARRAIRVHTSIQNMDATSWHTAEMEELFGFKINFRTLPLTLLVWLFLFLTITSAIVFLFEDSSYLWATAVTAAAGMFFRKVQRGLKNEQAWATVMASLLYLLLIPTPMCIFAVMGIVALVIHSPNEVTISPLQKV